MNIETAEFLFCRKRGANEITPDGLRHVKALPWLSVVQSVKGYYEIEIGSNPILETGNGGFFIAPSQVMQKIIHHPDPNTGRMENRWIFIDVYINKKYPLDFLFDFPIVIPEIQKARLNELFDQLFACKNYFDEMSIYYQILKVLIELAIPKNRENTDSLLNVIDYIHKHYAEDLTIEQLAKIAHISESHFYPSFKKVFGSSPISYLNNYRLSLASYMLKETTLPIKTIAQQVGFSDPFYFSKSFYNKYHSSPKKYREIAR